MKNRSQKITMKKQNEKIELGVDLLTTHFDNSFDFQSNFIKGEKGSRKSPIFYL